MSTRTLVYVRFHKQKCQDNVGMVLARSSHERRPQSVALPALFCLTRRTKAGGKGRARGGRGMGRVSVQRVKRDLLLVYTSEEVNTLLVHHS